MVIPAAVMTSATETLSWFRHQGNTALLQGRTPALNAHSIFQKRLQRSSETVSMATGLGREQARRDAPQSAPVCSQIFVQGDEDGADVLTFAQLLLRYVQESRSS